jgi:hypothetical protein
VGGGWAFFQAMSSLNHQTEELFSIFSLHGFVCWRKEDALIENFAT